MSRLAPLDLHPRSNSCPWLFMFIVERSFCGSIDLTGQFRYPPTEGSQDVFLLDSKDSFGNVFEAFAMASIGKGFGLLEASGEERECGYGLA